MEGVETIKLVQNKPNINGHDWKNTHDNTLDGMVIWRPFIYCKQLNTHADMVFNDIYTP
jgi:hypothetical protein